MIFFKDFNAARFHLRFSINGYKIKQTFTQLYNHYYIITGVKQNKSRNKVR